MRGKRQYGFSFLRGSNGWGMTWVELADSAEEGGGKVVS